MQNVQKPKNCYALAIYLLLENKSKGVTMKDAMKDYFHKFQTRLLDVEKSLSSNGNIRMNKLLVNRTTETKTGRFGNEISYTRYTATCNINYLINLVAYLNENGLNHKK